MLLVCVAFRRHWLLDNRTISPNAMTIIAKSLKVIHPNTQRFWEFSCIECDTFRRKSSLSLSPSSTQTHKYTHAHKQSYIQRYLIDEWDIERLPSNWTLVLANPLCNEYFIISYRKVKKSFYSILELNTATK